jgi:hypothetical protein
VKSKDCFKKIDQRDSHHHHDHDHDHHHHDHHHHYDDDHDDGFCGDDVCDSNIATILIKTITTTVKVARLGIQGAWPVFFLLFL